MTVNSAAKKMAAVLDLLSANAALTDGKPDEETSTRLLHRSKETWDRLDRLRTRPRGTMMRTFMAIAVALTGSTGLVAFTSSPAKAACSGGVCAKSKLNVRHGPGVTKLLITVQLSNKLVGISHYNVFVQCGGVVGSCGKQFESLGRFSFQINSPMRFVYTIQACRRGGFLQRSECAPRPAARFFHTVAPSELRGSVSQG